MRNDRALNRTSRRHYSVGSLPPALASYLRERSSSQGFRDTRLGIFYPVDSEPGRAFNAARRVLSLLIMILTNSRYFKGFLDPEFATNRKSGSVGVWKWWSMEHFNGEVKRLRDKHGETRLVNKFILTWKNEFCGRFRF